MDGRGSFEASSYYYVENPYINPMTRPPITDRLDF